MISEVITEAARCGAAILGVPVKSTIKNVDSSRRVKDTPRRNSLFEVQTPQVFKRELIINAYKKYPNVSAVDDAVLVERLGRRVRVVLGSYLNIKITTPDDLLLARSISKNKALLGAIL